MSNVLPTLLSGTVSKYPVTFTQEVITGVVQFVNDQEQRWPGRLTRNKFQLTYHNVSAYELDTFLVFFLSLKGMFVDTALTNTFSITDPKIPGQPYNFCYFESDSLEEQEVQPGFFNFTLKICQARQN